MCVLVCGSQKLTLRFLAQLLSTEPAVCQLGKTGWPLRARDALAFESAVLELQACAIMPDFLCGH